jgi:hypothetical protein
MDGLYLKTINNRTDCNRPAPTMRISSFCVNQETAALRRLSFHVPVGVWIPIKSKYERKGKGYKFLKCFHCLHEDFNDDGERLCDYKCNGCGLSISATEYKD